MNFKTGDTIKMVKTQEVMTITGVEIFCGTFGPTVNIVWAESDGFERLVNIEDFNGMVVNADIIRMVAQ